MTTVIDVAKVAGVSTATVSRVLNNSGYVGPSLRDKVLKAIKELNYSPNLVARGLRSESTSIIALMITDIENPFYTAVCRAVGDVASQAGFAVMICNTDDDLEKESGYITMFAGQRVAGVILTATSSILTDVQPFLARNIHVVALDRRVKTMTDFVAVDSKLGARMATEHLLESGAKRIACITGGVDVTSANDRLDGYLEALIAADIVPDKQLQFRANYREKGGADGINYLLDLDNPPDGIFIANNQMTTGALQALAGRDIEIREQIELVGFDELPLVDVHNRPITTVSQPTYEIGSTAASLLLDRIKGDSSEKKSILLEPQLHVRGSSAKVKVEF